MRGREGRAGRAGGRAERKKSGLGTTVREFGSRRNDLIRYYANGVSQLLAYLQ